MFEPMRDGMICPDLTKGPGGTKELLLDTIALPFEGWTGGLLKGWEMPDTSTLVAYVRPGIFYHDKPPVNGREFTAQI